MATPAAEQLPPIDTTNLHPQQPPPPMTDVDDPSHPLYHHRRTVADFDYGEALGEGSYSTVKISPTVMNARHSPASPFNVGTSSS
jgi:hypothetical protein